MRAALFTLMSVVCTVAVSATVYRWVDENGVTHYSDQPHENAEKVHVAAPQTYKATPPPKTPASSSDNAQAQPANTYQCRVTTPENDASFPNAYSVNAAVSISPSVQNGDQAYLLMDGARLPDFPPMGGAYTISNVERGQHTLQAVVQDANGKMVCQSENVTFTVLQSSVLNPANPNFKR
jgi:uncharacterized protein DUF4124